MQGSSGDTDIEITLMDMGRGRKVGGSMERVAWKLTLPSVKQITKGNLLYDSGNSNQGSVEGWEGGREVQEGRDICIPMAEYTYMERTKRLAGNGP